MVTKKGKAYYLRIRPFGTRNEREVMVRTPAISRSQAKMVQSAVLLACRSGNYAALDDASRETCIRMFRNRQWELPPELGGSVETPVLELTLWKGAELFLKYPDIKGSAERYRYELCLDKLIEHFGEDYPIKSIWVPQIKTFVAERMAQGAAPSTINQDKGTLSKMFQVLTELKLVEANPVQLVKNLSQKSEERQVYLSHTDVQQITGLCPEWLQPIIQTAYCTGMRRGEILGLTQGQVKLSRRMILLGPADTKGWDWKKVPIHRDLVPILEDVMKVRRIGNDRVFLVNGRTPNKWSLRKPWISAVEARELTPRPRFHDLRHTFRANARRSRVDPDVAEAIMGHAERQRRIRERYGKISDQELIDAIDRVTFDHGETEIMVAKK